jgi:hypothetical protein
MQESTVKGAFYFLEERLVVEN